MMVTCPRCGYVVPDKFACDECGHVIHWREQWFKLPMALRRRWWHETDFSRRKPSPALLAAIAAALKAADK
jgi:hypothetical protein